MPQTLGSKRRCLVGGGGREAGVSEMKAAWGINLNPAQGKKKLSLNHTKNQTRLQTRFIKRFLNLIFMASCENLLLSLVYL